MPKLPFLAILLASIHASALAQEKTPADPNARWEAAISKFEEADKSSPPKKNGILFVGSSSIRMWKLDESFPGFEAINRGFGGSEIENSTHFADRIIIPHRPHTVLLYAGDNDINKGKDAGRVVADYRAFVTKIRTALPETHIGFIAIKPSLARWRLWPEMKKANDAIAAICESDEGLEFLDIGKVTLGDDGKPQPELFLKDGLHCSAAGYAAWSKVVRPYLEVRKAESASK